MRRRKNVWLGQLGLAEMNDIAEGAQIQIVGFGQIPLRKLRRR